MEEFKPEHETPFAESLVKSKYNDETFLRKDNPEQYLAELKNNPNFVIRFEKMTDIVENPEKIFETIQKGKALLEELNDKYHIPVPVNFVIGKNDKGDAGLYTITSNIDGINTPKDAKNETEKEACQLQYKELVSTLIKYYSDKYRNNQPFLTDIYPCDQYKFGKKEADSHEHLYLIDTDAHNCSESNRKTFLERMEYQLKLLQEEYFPKYYQNGLLPEDAEDLEGGLMELQYLVGGELDSIRYGRT